MTKPFIEVDFAQQGKAGQGAAGDVFISTRRVDEDRLLCVLADGLGSGIKANVLATLTATMALKYVSSEMDIRRAAQVIMKTLPVCSQRKIGYSTFTIVDIRGNGRIRIVEYDNPPYVLLNRERPQAVEKRALEIEGPSLPSRRLFYSQVSVTEGSRLVLTSDGVCQSGMGSDAMPLGWTQPRVEAFLSRQVQRCPEISARQLSRLAVQEALRHDRYRAQDDISCAVITIRQPRFLRVLTGPPIDRNRDAELAALASDGAGRTVICGGTTANIVARELGKPIEVDLTALDPEVPPVSRLEGVDLVTEGTLTMSKAAEYLEQGIDPDRARPNAAVRLVDAFLRSDIIEFVVGTKINEAHQDPNLPVELDIRRNLIRRIVQLLNDTYIKQAHYRFI